MISSGTSAIVTNSSAAVEILPATPSTLFSHIAISNEGAAGFFSVDAGTTWARLVAGTTVLDDVTLVNVSIQIKRAGSTDMSGVYAFAW